MDIRPNEQQAMLRESAQRFLRDEYGFDRRRGHLGEGADRMWRKIADLGWTGAALPEEAGGLGGSAVELSILMEEMGRALYVGPFLSSTVCAAILQAVGGRRAGELLASVASGERRLALAHGEPGGRGFLDEASSTAREAAGAWRITGRKRLAYDVVSADLLVVTAAGPDGQLMFLVDPSAAGLVRRDYRTLDNGHASDLELDTVEAELLAGPDETARALDAALYAAFISLGAEALGVADAALRHTQDYVAVRKQFGRALTDFQVIQHRIADMFVEIEQLRAA
ncbi:acyl-CoA dehydrogenase family protein, partial [Rhizobiaceae sp. 2RAB30]